MEEKVYFENSKGNKLCYILSNPTGNRENPIIILCHGLNSCKNGTTFTRLEGMLNEKEISSFRFDFYGHGESEGKFEDVTVSEAVDDTLNVIKFLKDNGYRKIGLVGSSFGGLASIMTASKSDDLFVLALKCPVSNYKEKEYLTKMKRECEEWKQKGYIMWDGKLRLNYTFFEDFENNNGYEVAKKIKIPTIIVHGDKDKTVPIEQSKKTAKLIENCELQIIEGADHAFSNPEDFEKMLKLISEFIIENSK